MLECNTIVIIPCKMDSKRLPNKNLSLIGDKTLLEYAILYAQQSEYTRQIIVSTESDEVRDICKKYNGILIHHRPEHLLGDADTVDVYVEVFKYFQFDKKFPWVHSRVGITHIVGLQPDNPDRQKTLDEVLEYFITKKYDDLVTVGTDGTRNGSIRVIKSEFVREDNVSRRVGTILDDCTNIHTEDDLQIAKEKIFEYE